MGAQAFDDGVATLLASYRAIPPGATVRLAKKTSNLFRARAKNPHPGLDVSGLDRVISVDPVAKTADVAADQIVVHDAGLEDPAYAFALSRLSEQNLDHMVMGIFRKVSKPTYDDAARQQIATARDSRAHDTAALQALLRRGVLIV